MAVEQQGCREAGWSQLTEPPRVSWLRRQLPLMRGNPSGPNTCLLRSEPSEVDVHFCITRLFLSLFISEFSVSPVALHSFLNLKETWRHFHRKFSSLCFQRILFYFQVTSSNVVPKKCPDVCVYLFVYVCRYALAFKKFKRLFLKNDYIIRAEI